MRLLLLAHRTSPPIVGVAPTNVLAPFLLSGTPVVGATMTWNSGAWNGTPSPAQTSQIQFSADGTTGWTNVLPAGQDPVDHGTYHVQPGDDGVFLADLVTAVNASGSASLRSAASGPVTTPISPPGPVSPPVIS